ncbi:399_t:CDS:2 [Ambispora leptoticha]|uniref:399_t:CDS:1 n=1 Tax=Ambispora leptoticha TaxID=144679 RepID=A0A9N9C821_9GLOM|nr:399_t:CDS:2 [Ambispora leptoticha]
MKQLKQLSINDTDINEVNLTKLPNSLWRIGCLTELRPTCKLIEIVPLLKNREKYEITGQQLIEKFIEKQQAKAIDKDREVVLKSLTNSQNITLEFLMEIANNKLVDDSAEIVKCHGISQDPRSENYLMVMDYMKDGNLRDFLKNRYSELSFEDKLEKLHSIAFGKLINTKQITQLLQTSKLKSGYGDSQQIDLDINDFNLDELNLQEDLQEQSSTQAQIQIPPK